MANIKARLRLGTLLLIGLLGCSNAGEDLGFSPSGSGTVLVLVYFDRDGSLDITQPDTAFAGIRVGLVVSGTTDTTLTATTDSVGNVRFTGVPFGNYQFVVDSNSLGDSLEVQAIDVPSLMLRANAAQQTVIGRVGFPVATVAGARVLASGTRVIVTGQILSGVDVFGDSTAHLADAGVAIRLTNAIDLGPPSAPGDSARVLATVSARSGQPVLDSARVFVYRLGQISAPVSLTTLLASNADTARQDANLVQLTDAIITDTLTVGTDYHVTVDDGTGPLIIELDGDIVFPKGQYIIGKKVNGRGVLVPAGNGSWLFKPRVPNDVTIT
ncbi:MAG: hypothetical protein ABI613_11280 [Gemmatimonadota bacterium]